MEILDWSGHRPTAPKARGSQARVEEEEPRLCCMVEKFGWRSREWEKLRGDGRHFYGRSIATPGTRVMIMWLLVLFWMRRFV